MNRIAIKFAALFLLSTGYVMASQKIPTNPLKDVGKTNLTCSCQTVGGGIGSPDPDAIFSVSCLTGTCTTCCNEHGGLPFPQ